MLAAIDWGTVFTGMIALTGFLGWGGTWLVKQLRSRQGRASGIHERILRLENEMKALQDWWNGVPGGFLRSGTIGFKDQFIIMTKTVEDHTHTLGDIQTELASLKTMLSPNGGNTDEPGDRLLRIEDALRDVVKILKTKEDR